ncbi:MAG: hypothetical protein ACUZ8H_05490 [Candidatus Anammoxibacter sp.]
MASTNAVAANINLHVRATILNMNEWPTMEALEECSIKGWVCQGPCKNGDIEDVVEAYRLWGICSDRASQYADTPFNQPLIEESAPQSITIDDDVIFQ